MLKKKLLKQARGIEKADKVFKNAIYVDVFNERLMESDIAVADGIIIGVGDYQAEEEIDLSGKIVIPGLIDAHLHLESSMTNVDHFARAVIPKGTTTIVADPHEIANVAGLTGIKYLLQAGKAQAWNFNLMLPSCVPASEFEHSGAELKAADLKTLIGEEGIFGLGEVMNYPAVINGESEIWSKIEMAAELFKDGHAPGLLGKDLNAYLLAGIAADHEATTAAEALEKISKGMYIMIREGSVTRDLVSLLPAVNSSNSSRFLFATDDRHPGDLIDEGQIDFAVRKAVQYGLSPLRAIKMATINAAEALGIKKLGAVAPGYRADLLVLDNLRNFEVEKVYKDGKLVAENGTLLKSIDDQISLTQDNFSSKEIEEKIFNSVKIGNISEKDFKLPPAKKYRVIELIKEQVVTGESFYQTESEYKTEPLSIELIGHNLVKLAVVERHYRTGNVGLGLLRNFGLRRGAVATSIGHDAHNIIVAGLAAKDMELAVREIEKMQGGLAIVVDGIVEETLALPVAGLMALKPVKEVASRLNKMRELANNLGVNRDGPFMTLSFMALTVIPKLKLTDSGLFDVNKFENVELVIE
ncbi:Adenine deaminase [Halanaerobium saccharolyticum subsp. saccharolyticum DSM 6643]|uniref:Adenine deaminase n=1 Tax=Halanaerobium saccharolyticum subsp. saccharolyticum DSM 6643 TaxID=1293054 RepID=M5E4U2_9FIRM|nr:adenine deaminase [Halanaerobium saccharolyticum]CCU81039.1 Adenine deaminase [Halanaerobium saccharolyticum subsp. saccharolyticum DSM 6643]